MEKETNLMINILFISFFLVILVFSAVLIIKGLNSGNRSLGHTETLAVEETVYAVLNSTKELNTSGIYNPSCSINSIKDLLGNDIPTSNYTVNNCEITYTP